MKLATRISSIRRMAWKACRSCSPTRTRCGRTRWPGSALAGWTRSPRASSTRVTGCWASQSISRSGWQARAARRRSRRRAGRGRGRSARRGTARACGRERPRRRRGGGPARAGEVADDAGWSRPGRGACGAWPEPSSVTSRAPGMASATAAPRAGPTTASAEPWTTRVGQRTCAQSAQRVSRGRSATPRPCRGGSSAGRSSRPQPIASSICLVECGSVNISREEEARGIRASRGASSGGSTWPSRRASRGSLVERERALLFGRVRGQQQIGRDQHEAADPLRVLGRQEQVVARAAPGHDDRLRHAHVIQHRQRVVGGGPPVVGAHLLPAGPSARCPRRSNVTTRACRARYGIWAFQAREWTISQVGSSRMVGSPVPYTS